MFASRLLRVTLSVRGSLARAALSLVVAATVLGTAAARADEPPLDMDGLEKLGRTLRDLDPAVAPQALLTGLAEVEIGIDSACKTALKEIPKEKPDARSMGALNAAQICHANCVREVGRIISESRLIESSRAAIEACDKVGTDTIFVGPIAPWREEIEIGHYILLRHLLGQIKSRLAANGSRGRAIWGQFERRVPGLAATLIVLHRHVRQKREADGAATMEKLKGTGGPVHRGGPPLVSLIGGDLYLDSESIAGVGDLAKKRGGSSWAYPPLRRRLERWNKGFSKEHPGTTVRQVVVRPDFNVKFGAIKRVLFTAEEVGFDQFDFATPLHDHDLLKVRWSGAIAAPLVLALAPPPDRVEWDLEGATSDAPEAATATPASATGHSADDDAADDDAAGEARHAHKKVAGATLMTIEEAAVVISGGKGAMTRVPDAGGQLDKAKLAKTLGWMSQKQKPPIVIAADSAITYRRLVDVIYTTLAAGFAQVSIDTQPTAEEWSEDKPVEAPPEISGHPEGLPLPGAGKHGDAAADKEPLDLGSLGSTRSDDKTTGLAARLQAAGGDVMAGAPDVHGPFEKDAVMTTVQAGLNELRACYQRALDTRPALSGMMTFQYNISGAGLVTAAAMPMTTAKEPNVEHCMSASIRRWHFPRSESGGGAIVIQRFTLKPPGH